MNFRKDLKFGHKYESIAVSHFKGSKIDHPKDRKVYGYDFIVDGVKFEVKSDRIAYRTGNLAIEYESRGVPSGIMTTEADYYMYFIVRGSTHECFKIPVKELKELCPKYGRDIIGGDFKTSRMYLINRRHINKYLIKL